MSEEGHVNCLALLKNPGSQLLEIILESERRLRDISNQEKILLKFREMLVEDLKVNHPNTYISYMDFDNEAKMAMMDVYKICREYFKGLNSNEH